MDKIDYKKKNKELYFPKTTPTIVNVPKMTFIVVDGKGNPNNKDGEYPKALEILYGLSYTIRMNKNLDGYFEYVVPPLEGLWWFEGDKFDHSYIMDKDKFNWTSMIRQPDFINEEIFSWAKETLKKKKPELDLSKAKLVTFEEGLCCQIMHIGSYDLEKESVQKIEDYIKDNGYKNAISDSVDGFIKRHHEIYLGDPRKTDVDKLKTVIRHPIKKEGK